MTPEEEVQFWRRFYSESLRLYGDKRGTLSELTMKAMDRLGNECLLVATASPDETSKDKASNSEGFKAEQFMAHCDEVSRKDWGKRHVPGRVVLAYLNACDDLPRDAAIREVARKFRFPSYEAAYKFLQRQGVKGLPSTWPT